MAAWGFPLPLLTLLTIPLGVVRLRVLLGDVHGDLLGQSSYNNIALKARHVLAMHVAIHAVKDKRLSGQSAPLCLNVMVPNAKVLL